MLLSDCPAARDKLQQTKGGAEMQNTEKLAGARRAEFTFRLDPELVERARVEVGEQDVVRSIEAALAAAIDYQLWVREVVSGRRGVLT
jgi:hypothetical protein